MDEEGGKPCKSMAAFHRPGCSALVHHAITDVFLP